MTDKRSDLRLAFTCVVIGAIAAFGAAAIALGVARYTQAVGSACGGVVLVVMAMGLSRRIAPRSGS
jgi:hypothetical protein